MTAELVRCWPTGFLPVTLAVLDDEPCLEVQEVIRMAPGSRGWRRAQIVTVVRDDRPAEFAQDLGPSTSFATPEFRIPGGVVDDRTGRIDIVHTVGELREIAERLRTGWVQQPEPRPASDLIGGYYDHMEQKRLYARRRSVMGRYHRVERS